MKTMKTNDLVKLSFFVAIIILLAATPVFKVIFPWDLPEPPLSTSPLLSVVFCWDHFMAPFWDLFLVLRA